MKLQRLPKVEFRLELAPHGYCNVRRIVLNNVETQIWISPEIALDWKSSIWVDDIKESINQELMMNGVLDAIDRDYIINETEKFVLSPGYKF